MKFSLCIITENCYDESLQNNLSFFLNEPLIDDIIVFDKDGSDIVKVRNNSLFKNTYKLNLILGCKNTDEISIKLKCGNLAKNQWIAFYDSILLPDTSFFNNAKNYISQNCIFYQNHVALAPCYAKGNGYGHGFHHHIAGNIITKENLISFRNEQYNRDKKRNNGLFHLLSTGSFIYNCSIFKDIDLSKDKHLISDSIRHNTLMLNTIMFEQLNNFEFHVVAGLEYENKFSSQRETAFKNNLKQEVVYNLEFRIWDCCNKITKEEDFFEACKNNNIELVKLYLTHGINKNWRDKNDLTPLMIACINGNSEIVQALLE